MERLTHRETPENTAYVDCCMVSLNWYSMTDEGFRGPAIDRLAAYEDTGLTPKEVKLIANVLREVGETYNCWFNYVAQCVIEHSKLQKLAQAERAGRLVVLPDGDDTAALAATIDSTDMIRVWSGGDSDLLIGLLSMLAREVAQRAGIQYGDLLEAMSICPPVGTSSIIKTEEGKSNEKG